MIFPYLRFSHRPRARALLLQGGLFLFILWLIIFSSLPGLSATEEPLPRVIILNSYHPGFTWSDRELSGVLQELQRHYPNLDPAIEYLDTKRFPTAEHLLKVKNFLASKYHGEKFDLVITLDNPALELMLTYRPELFPGAPIVFAGINDFQPAKLAGQNKVTGVAEVLDIEGTLKTALSLHPKTKEIFVVLDYTMTGQVVRKELEALLPAFKSRVQVKFAPRATMAEILEQLKALPNDAIVFVTGFATDSAGQTFSMAEGVRRLTKAAKVPVYTVHAGRLGSGAVGGILLSGLEEGRRAGEIALQVLAGEDPSRIPVDTKSLARPMFDYRQLTRFNIPIQALPAGSLVINRPSSFYEIHKSLVGGAFVVVIALILVVTVLSINITRRRQAEKKLAHNLLFLQKLLDTIPNPVFYKDTRGVYLGCNKALEEFLGLPKAGIVGKTVFDTYPKELAEKYFKMDQELFDHPGSQIYEFVMDRSDGSRKDFIFTKATFLDQDGRLAGLIGVMTDITERKQTEAALRESEEKFRLVFEKAPIGIMHYDQTSTITDCNAKFAEIIGAPKQKFVGYKLIGGLRDDQMREAVTASLRGEVGYYDGDYLSVTGRKLTPIRAICQPIFSPEGGLSGGVAIFEDITARKQAEAELRLKEKLLDSASDSIFLHDQEGNFLYINEAAYISRGYREEELLNLGVSALITPEAAADRENTLTELLVNGEIIFETTHLRKDGSTMPVEIHARLLDVEGRELILSVARDITERKRAEKELQAAARKWQTTFDAISDAVCLLDPDGTMLQCNQAMVDLVGKPLADIQGRQCYEVLHGTAQPIDNCPLVRMRETRQREELLLSLENRWFKLGVDPIFNETGDLVGAVHIMLDVTQLKNAERSLYRRSQELMILNTIGGVVSRTLDLDQILADALEVIQQNMFDGHSQTVVFLMDEATRALKAASHRGFPADHPCLERSLNLGECFCGQVAQTGKLVIKRAVCEHCVVGRHAPDTIPHQDISLPLKVQDRLLGVLHVSLPLGQELDARHLKMLEAVTDQISVAVENARLFDEVKAQGSQLRALAARLAEIEETDRQHLARELHDQVGQSLTTLSLYLTMLQEQMPNEVPKNILNRLEDAATLVEQTSDTVRDVMAELRPPVLDYYGLMAAVRWYGKQFFENTGIKVTVQGDDKTPRLDRGVEMALFRIIQEALTNVAKHARASRVTVTEEVHDAKVRLTIADNGIGFDQTRVGQPEGRHSWGLMTMSERALAAGGDCHIMSRPGQGTQVIVEVSP